MVNLEITIALLALTGVSFILLKNKALQVIGLLLIIIGSILGSIFFAVVHLYALAVTSMIFLVISSKRILKAGRRK